MIYHENINYLSSFTRWKRSTTNIYTFTQRPTAIKRSLCSSSPRPCIWFILRLIFHRIVIDTRQRLSTRVHGSSDAFNYERWSIEVQQRMKRSERGSRPVESGQPHHVSFWSIIPACAFVLSAFDRARKILRGNSRDLWCEGKKERDEKNRRRYICCRCFIAVFDTFLCFCAMFDSASFFFFLFYNASHAMIHFSRHRIERIRETFESCEKSTLTLSTYRQLLYILFYRVGKQFLGKKRKKVENWKIYCVDILLVIK